MYQAIYKQTRAGGRKPQNVRKRIAEMNIEYDARCICEGLRHEGLAAIKVLSLRKCTCCAKAAFDIHFYASGVVSKE